MRYGGPLGHVRFAVLIVGLVGLLAACGGPPPPAVEDGELRVASPGEFAECRSEETRRVQQLDDALWPTLGDTILDWDGAWTVISTEPDLRVLERVEALELTGVTQAEMSRVIRASGGLIQVLLTEHEPLRGDPPESPTGIAYAYHMADTIGALQEGGDVLVGLQQWNEDTWSIIPLAARMDDGSIAFLGDCRPQWAEAFTDFADGHDISAAEALTEILADPNSELAGEFRDSTAARTSSGA